MTGEIITGAITGGVAVICLLISIRQFKNKGMLFNNAYIYATKDEREAMDKKPYYRQSAIVFLFLTGIFALLAVEALTGARWLSILVGLLCAGVLVYAIVSYVMIEKKNK